MGTLHVNFSGEIEWLVTGDHIVVDDASKGLLDLFENSRKEIFTLSQMFHEQPIKELNHLPILKLMLKQYGNKYEQLYLSYQHGDYFNACGQKNNIMDRRYFRQVMDGKTVISEPLVNRSTHKPVIVIATPVFYSNKINGLFGATILLNRNYKGLHYLYTENKQPLHQLKQTSRS